MLKPEDNERICRVGAGTPMGTLMRRYWQPALLSEELPEPDGPPVRVRLLGESLIAIRTTSGQVGLLAHSCPHRGASLFFGRNEEEGIRCVYHGWKFDVAGRCVDMPSEPPESTFKDKVRARAYPCQERNGIVWAYLGPRAVPPPLPDLEGNMLPEGQWAVAAVLRECNWLQALEGDIDTAHLGFLHLGGIPVEAALPGTFSEYTLRHRAPRFQVLQTEYGTMYGAYRPAGEGEYYWRLAHFLFPFYTMPPVGVLGLKVIARAWVPMDDEHTLFFSMGPRQRMTPSSQESVVFDGTSLGLTKMLPNTTDWYGRWRAEADSRNDYHIDRAKQRAGHFTGIDGIHLQDQAITESMGPVIDRTQERLGSSDVMIIRTRQRLLEAVKALRDAGATPPGVDEPGVYAVRAGGIILPRDADWVEATRERRAGFVEHPELDVEISGNIPGA
ncbi:MAG TPA: Rieske 2Fe-2S domain-containing protein [Chloroflexota bacterium]|nr:Rieske 2Fe-2S domain-containing protein [Chloroflexota bacterium]